MNEHHHHAAFVLRHWPYIAAATAAFKSIAGLALPNERAPRHLSRLGLPNIREPNSGNLRVCSVLRT